MSKSEIEGAPDARLLHRSGHESNDEKYWVDQAAPRQTDEGSVIASEEVAEEACETQTSLHLQGACGGQGNC